MGISSDDPISVDDVARLDREGRDSTGTRSFDKILGGFRDGVAASGIADAEVDRLFESAREDVLAERQR